MIMLILIIKTFIFYEQRNKKIKEVNKTEPREIIQVWNKNNKIRRFLQWGKPRFGSFRLFSVLFLFSINKKILRRVAATFEWLRY